MQNKIQVLKEIFGPYYKSKNEYLFKCPFCEHHKKKLSINLDLNVYKCWVCDSKGKNIQYLIKKFASRQILKKWQLLDEKVDMSIGDDLFDEVLEEEQILKLPVEYVCLANKNLPMTAKKALNYLKKRGIIEKDIKYFKIGFCEEGEYKCRIIIPSFNEEGYCNYFIARTYTDDWLGYKNPEASKDIIFNDLLMDWNEPITIVEGIFDAIKAENSIPLLGSTLNEKSKIFCKLIEKTKCVYLALDKDALKKSFLIVKDLLEYGVEVYRIDTSKIDDIGSISKAEALELRKTALPMTFDNYIDMRYKIS
jgi:DNA primase